MYACIAFGIKRSSDTFKRRYPVYGLPLQYKRNEPMPALSSVQTFTPFPVDTTRWLTFQGREDSVSQLKNLFCSVGQVEIMSGQDQPRAVLLIQLKQKGLDICGRFLV